MATANEHQVGGSHYKNAEQFEHWDLCLAVGMGYLEGNATKYVSRWRKKAGLQDLQKALHYVDKLLEWMGDRFPVDTREFPTPEDKQQTFDALGRFAQINDLSPLERHFVMRLATWSGRDEVEEARVVLLKLIDHASDSSVAQVPEAQPVPLTEENHYAERVVKDTTHKE